VDRTYFTWPDGRFRYDCRGCGACCKGHGIGLDVAGGQLVQLLARRPAIAAFLRRRGEAITAFNPRDRCWFLADDGLCRIEVEDGRAAKPASCRLFPFNRIFRLGTYTIVDYNSVICPLHVTNDGGVRHADIAAEIASIADASVVGTPLPATDAEAEGRALVDAERAIAAAVFAAAGAAPGDLAALWSPQASPAALDRERSAPAAWASQTDPATRSAAQADPAALEPTGRLVPRPAGSAGSVSTPDLASLDRERATAAAAFTAILGTSWQLPSHPTLTAASWLTPSLRFNELYGPRQYAPRPAMAPVLARMWLAWLGFAALGEQLAERPLGLQELTTLWSEQAPLMHAIARWSEAPALKPGPIDLPSVDPGSHVRALAQAFIDNRKARRPLGELIAALPADPAARVTALKTAEAIVRSGFAGR
jgi:Fe-S-cluster containining protein